MKNEKYHGEDVPFDGAKLSRLNKIQKLIRQTHSIGEQCNELGITPNGITALMATLHLHAGDCL